MDFSGYKRIVSKEKDEGRMKKEEGKQPLTVPSFALLSKAMLTNMQLYTFARAFLAMQAALGDRSVSTATINLASVGWEHV